MSKVVFNNNWGGYGLPEEVLKEYCRREGIDYSEDSHWSLEDAIPRHDPVLVEIVENYLKTENSTLSIEDIGDADRYHIEEYDGWETVRTVDTTHWISTISKLSKEDL